MRFRELGRGVGLIALTAVGAFGQTTSTASSFRDELPEWLDIRPELRIRYEGRQGDAFDIQVPHGVLTRAFLGIDVKPTRRLRFHVQGMDARMPTIDRARLTNRYHDAFEFREAYVEIGDPTQDRWQLQIGRQMHSYGSERVIARANWSNSRRGFDAIKLKRRHEAVDLDIFTGSVVKEFMDSPDRSDYGNGFHGAYSSWKQLLPGAELDLYLLYRTRRRVTDELGRVGDGDLWTPGVRLSGEAAGAVNYDVEWNIQRGDFAASDVRAQTFTARGGYRFAELPAEPRIFGVYRFASGDSDPTDGVAGTADQFFPANHRHRGVADLIGYRNLRGVGAGVEVKPAAKTTMVFQVDHYGLASRNDGYYTFDGRLLVDAVPGGAESTSIGVEVDVSASYQLNPFTSLSVGIGRLARGGFLRRHSDLESSAYSYAAVEFRP